MTGQAIVEFALIAPMLMLLMLGIIGAGLVHVRWHQYQNAVQVLATLAAVEPNDSWRSHIHDVNERHKCDLVGSVEAQDTPEGTVVVTETCLFDFAILPVFHNLPVTVTYEAARPFEVAEPSPSPS